MLRVVLVWADIENEPQVQYLLPVVDACRRLGSQVVVTARNYGAAIPLLESRGVSFHAVGTAYGASRLAKVRGLVGRSRDLVSLLRREAVPDCLVCASRAGVLAARRFGIPSFVISDYEHANLTVFRWAGSTILHPSVIDAELYRRAGIRDDRLIPFEGLKEDITFSGVDVQGVEAASLDAGPSEDLVRVLVRPPAEDSHYYVHRSRSLYLEALAFLARDERAQVVLAPRYERQVDDLRGFQFVHMPFVIREPIEFVSLLKAVDLVLCSGGTMLREAAYLGVPAFSIFGSRIGQVDRYLESIGRVTLIASPAELDRIKIEKVSGLLPLRGNPGLPDELAEIVTGRAHHP